MISGKHSRAQEKAALAKKSQLPWPGPEWATNVTRRVIDPPGFLTNPVMILVFSMHCYKSYWKQVPSISDAAKSVVQIQPAQPGLLPPPIMSSEVPSQLQSTYENAKRAAKFAWLLESMRMNSTDEEVSDEHLNRMYASGRKHYNQVSSPLRQKRTYANASQQASLQGQVETGQSQCPH